MFPDVPEKPPYSLGHGTHFQVVATFRWRIQGMTDKPGPWPALQLRISASTVPILSPRAVQLLVAFSTEPGLITSISSLEARRSNFLFASFGPFQQTPIIVESVSLVPRAPAWHLRQLVRVSGRTRLIHGRVVKARAARVNGMIG